MKFKTTKKAIKENYGEIYRVPYCEAWHLLRGIEPFAYNSGVYGWNCDYYYINGRIICTGYRPHGESTRGVTNKYEEQAKSIYNNNVYTYTDKMELLYNLRDQWINNLSNMYEV